VNGRREREVISSGAVARMYGVDGKTVSRWDKEDKLKPAFRTPGGRRRYYRDEIEKLIAGTAS
jgi:DNA-binding transcriptional MerR regulator